MVARNCQRISYLLGCHGDSLDGTCNGETREMNFLSRGRVRAREGLADLRIWRCYMYMYMMHMHA